MSLPIAITEGILLALAALVVLYVLFEVLAFLVSSGMIGLFTARNLWKGVRILAVAAWESLCERPEGPRISKYRWYRTDEGQRELYQQIRIGARTAVFTIAALVILFLCAWFRDPY